MCAVTLGAYASFFEVQVAMSESALMARKLNLQTGISIPLFNLSMTSDTLTVPDNRRVVVAIRQTDRVG